MTLILKPKQTRFQTPFLITYSSIEVARQAKSISKLGTVNFPPVTPGTPGSSRICKKRQGNRVLNKRIDRHRSSIFYKARHLAERDVRTLRNRINAHLYSAVFSQRIDVDHTRAVLAEDARSRKDRLQGIALLAT